MYDKQVLLRVEDGPESIEIYTSEDEGIIDWASTLPGVYLTATVNGASVKLGPFHCTNILLGLRAVLGGNA